MHPFCRLCNPKLQILGLSRPAGAVPLLLLGLALLALALPLVGQLLEPVGLRLLPCLLGLLLAFLLGLLPALVSFLIRRSVGEPEGYIEKIRASKSALPIGLQAIGRRGHDHALLRLAGWLEGVLAA